MTTSTAVEVRSYTCVCGNIVEAADNVDVSSVICQGPNGDLDAHPLGGRTQPGHCWCGRVLPISPLAMCWGPEGMHHPHTPAEVYAPPDATRRAVAFHMDGEDFRALIARCLLFAGDERARLAVVRIEITPHWAIAVATDGYTLAVQKMRCESDGEGVFALSTYDAERMLRMVPRPHKDEVLGRVELNFVTPGARGAPIPIDLRYTGDDDRSVSYGCHGMNPAEFPAYGKLLEPDELPQSYEGRFIVAPEFMSRVAKAEIVAKDQTPLVVRWHLVASDHGPRLVATFAVNETHDEFLALLMPMVLEWPPSTEIASVAWRMGDTSAPSTRAFPLQIGIDE